MFLFFLRISIPRSTLLTPYRIQPHRRRSFDETDSYALSKVGTSAVEKFPCIIIFCL